MEKMAVE